MGGSSQQGVNAAGGFSLARNQRETVTLSISTRATAMSAAVLLLAACSPGDRGTAGPGKDPSGSNGPVAQLFPDDFEGVCSGATESQAADYARSGKHKAVYFETYEDKLLDESSRLPTDWTVEFDAASNAYAAVGVVGCGVRTDDKLAKKCTGYEDEDTHTKGSVNWYTATYELSAYKAKTGKKLGSATIRSDSQDCPTFASFDEGENETDMYDSPSDQEVTSFLKKYVQP
jgi:hypothetical protein